MLEIVDLEFQRVLEQRSKYRDALDNTDITDEALNVEVLEKLLDKFWPPENKKIGDENYSELLRDLLQFEFRSSGPLLAMLNRHRAEVLREDKKLMDSPLRPKGDKRPHGVYFNHEGLTRTALSLAFPTRWKAYSRKWNLFPGKRRPGERLGPPIPDSPLLNHAPARVND